jgi:hypothetical protein
MITATNPFTGEVFELNDSTPSDLEAAYNFLKTFEKTIKSMQEQWRKRVMAACDDTGSVETPNGRLRHIVTQRMTYDKSALRNLLDEDTLDTFLVVKKGLVDEWLKERVRKGDIEPEVNREIRNSLIEDGAPYATVKYEKMTA